jgi:ABC-2 type transport system ATP-binding protein
MIRTEHLTKAYGSFEALSDLNLTVEEGKVFGFIGPNGAGKSTTMLILSTLLLPTKGKAFVGGYDVTAHPKEVRKLVGYMPDFFGVYDQLKATEYLDFYAGAYEIPVRDRGRLIHDLLELVNLSDKANTYVDSLSRGMKQRLGLARCLIHDPKVLILDEPASGLDPRARIEMRQILRQLKGMNKTILISSHILPELGDVCDEIGVIEKGKLVAYSSIGQLDSDSLTQIKIIELQVLGDPEVARGVLEQNSEVKLVDQQAGRFRFQFRGDLHSQTELLKGMILQGVMVSEFAHVKENLEDVFLAITGGGSSS